MRIGVPDTIKVPEGHKKYVLSDKFPKRMLTVQRELGTAFAYSFYPFKRNTNSTNMHARYPESYLSNNHRYSLNYNEYVIIVKVFMKQIWEFMKDGKVFYVPSGLGSCQLARVKKNVYIVGGQLSLRKRFFGYRVYPRYNRHKCYYRSRRYWTMYYRKPARKDLNVFLSEDEYRVFNYDELVIR